MEEKGLEIEINVTCRDDATAKRYVELAEKMASDKEFLEKAKSTKNMQELYDTYKADGYTDMDINSFADGLGDELGQIGDINPAEMHELSEDELDKVAGGSWWGKLFNFVCTVVDFIPVAGPLITGAAKVIKAIVRGEGVHAIVRAAVSGVTSAVLDAGLALASGGYSALLKPGKLISRIFTKSVLGAPGIMNG